MISRHWAVALVATCAFASPLCGDAQPKPYIEPPSAPPGMLDWRFPVKPLDDALDELRRNRLAAPALERYEAGDYRAAAQLGLAVLEQGADQPELRYAVANSLAWTGRYDPALEQYRALLGGAYDSRARIGIANVMAWNGRADLAEPHYLAVLEREPTNEDARRGLALAGRELRPALTLKLGQTEDNQQFTRTELSLSYRQWSADRVWRFELGALRDWNEAPALNATRNGVQGSIWAAGMPLAPRLEASVYDNEVFGSLQIEPVRDHLRLRVGRVNWGRLAFTAAALADHLTANTIGVLAEARPTLGAVRLRLDGYDVSDGNRVLDGELQLTPGWQPLPWRLEWFGGAYGRSAARQDPRYWSPKPAYGLAFLGVRRSWSSDRSDFSAWLRAGAGFTDTAKASWSGGLSGRYWLSADLALGLEAWALDAPRPTPYRMHQLAAFVQLLL